jgi:hypothetical protein
VHVGREVCSCFTSSSPHFACASSRFATLLGREDGHGGHVAGTSSAFHHRQGFCLDRTSRVEKKHIPSRKGTLAAHSACWEDVLELIGRGSLGL